VSSSIEDSLASNYSEAMTQHTPALLQTSAQWEAIFRSSLSLKISYAPGEMVCQAGSYVAGIHLIVQGAVSDRMLTQTGEPRSSDILGPGDLLGLEILESNSANLSVSLCRALTGVELLFVEREQFASALDDNPSLLRTMFHYAVSRVVSTRKDPRQQTSSEGQLCRLLLRLGETCGTPSGEFTIALPSEISQRALGDLLCMSSRQLRQAIQALQNLKIGESGIEFDTDEARQIIGNTAFAAR